MKDSKLITFDNGLKLEFVKKPKNMVQASLKVSFLVGSEDETKEEGLAHLLEHCMFKGTKEYSQAELSIELDKLSAIPNASTSAEFTIYEAKFPKFNIEKLVELFSKMIFESTFKDQEIESEKLVVLEEIKMHNDVPSDCAFDQLINTMYAGTSLGFDIAGDASLLKKVTRQHLIEFRNKYYIPQNTIISVVGDFEEPYVKAIVEKYFVSRFCEINDGVLTQKCWTKAVNNTPKMVVKDKKINQANVMMGAYTTGYENPDRLKLAIILFVLGGSMSSRLFVRLRNELSLCYSIYTDHLNYKNNGFMLIDFSTSNAFCDKAIEEVKSVINEVIKNGITNDEFELAKNVLLNNFLMSQDIPQSHISYIAYTGELFDAKLREQDIRKLQKKECEDVFRKYISPEKFFISIVK